MSAAPRAASVAPVGPTWMHVIDAIKELTHQNLVTVILNVSLLFVSGVSVPSDPP